MSNEELKIYGLKKTKDTEEASYVSGEQVYESINHDGFIISTYDFLRERSLPSGVWGIYKYTDEGLFNIHINGNMLFDNPDSVEWSISILQLQIYLKGEENE